MSPWGIIVLIVGASGALALAACSTPSTSEQDTATSQEEDSGKLCTNLGKTCAWLKDTTGHRAQLRMFMEEGQVIINQRPATPEGKIEKARALIAHAKKFNMLLTDMNTMPADVFESAERAQDAEVMYAGVLFKEGAAEFRAMGKAGEARETYGEILRTFDKPSQEALRIEAATALQSLDAKSDANR